MTIDEILRCKIPKGDYFEYMDAMQFSLKCGGFSEGFTKSLCASFEALLGLAKGETHDNK